MRVPRTAATAEAVPLTILLTNLLAVHAAPITGVAGTVHGTAHVAVIAAARPT